MVIADPGWLHTLGQIAGVVLLIELGLVLIVVCALMIALAIAARWLHTHVVPVLHQYTPKARDAMAVAQQSSDKVVTTVAEFYGRRQQVETSLRVLLFGRKAADRVHEDAMIQASSDLQLMSTGENLPGPENGYTPRPHGQSAADAADGAARENGRGRASAYDDHPTLTGNAG